MALETVPHTLQIRFSFPPYPGADLKTIQVNLPEGALLLDAIRQCCIEHHVPVYLEHSFMSTAQSLIQSTRRATVDKEIMNVNQNIFSKSTNFGEDAAQSNDLSKESNTSGDTNGGEKDLDIEEQALQKAMIANYRNRTSQYYTQPEEVCRLGSLIIRGDYAEITNLTCINRMYSQKLTTRLFIHQSHSYSTR